MGELTLFQNEEMPNQYMFVFPQNHIFIHQQYDSQTDVSYRESESYSMKDFSQVDQISKIRAKLDFTMLF